MPADKSPQIIYAEEFGIRARIVGESRCDPGGTSAKREELLESRITRREDGIILAGVHRGRTIAGRDHLLVQLLSGANAKDIDSSPRCDGFGKV